MRSMMKSFRRACRAACLGAAFEGDIVRAMGVYAISLRAREEIRVWGRERGRRDGQGDYGFGDRLCRCSLSLYM